jgi:hypothetical protein
MSVSLDELLHETKVYERWGHLLVDKELRQARQAKIIEWFDLRSGPHYTEAQVLEYLSKRIIKPCESKALEHENSNASSNSGNNGSAKSKKAALSIVTGMTPENEKLAAAALELGA